jgi:hypothetical protein
MTIEPVATEPGEVEPVPGPRIVNVENLSCPHCDAVRTTLRHEEGRPGVLRAESIRTCHEEALACPCRCHDTYRSIWHG